MAELAASEPGPFPSPLGDPSRLGDPSPLGDVVVSLSGASLIYAQDGVDTPVFTNLDLDFRAGEFVALLGPSGVGKSTLLRIIMGLVPPSAGSVTMTGPKTTAHRAALVFQDSRLLPWRTVLANVAFGLEGHGLSRAEREKRALQALELVGLTDYARRWPRQLSGGQRQRAGVARALTVDPALLLMDEPFGALDAITRGALQEELLRIWQRTGKTIVFVTHDIDEALILADRIIVLAGHPATVRADVMAGPRPRDRSSPKLQALAIYLKAVIAGETPSLDDCLATAADI